jgi:chromosome segregation and condensation protein ScpB
MDKKSQLEAIIFSEGAEARIKDVCKILTIDNAELTTMVGEYNLSKRGTVLVLDDKKVLMRVAAEHAELVEAMRKDEQSQDLSKAALEVLSIVLYSDGGSMSASGVEHIRGVNSGYSLRQLTMRGLLSKSRVGMSYKYSPTAELLSFLGITTQTELPNLSEVRQKIQKFNDRENG